MISIVKYRLSHQKRLLYVLKSMASSNKKASCFQNPLDSIIQQSESPTTEVKTYEFCKQYIQLTTTERYEFLKKLCSSYDIDKEALKKAAESYISLQDKSTGLQQKAAEKLKLSLNPHYAQAFNHIRKINGGVKFLVDLRADLLNVLPISNFNDESTYHLKGLNNYLKEILSFSFNVGSLKLERVTWDSSCYMLEKISEYEAVHPVRNWTDLKQRVGPYRRCYVFTHSSMPKEPIVVLHTALTSDISSNIASIVRQNRLHSEGDLYDANVPDKLVEDPKRVQAAVFYSVTSTQKGLHGIELGNQLIKRVVKEVLAEFPQINKLSSLSPIPGFRDWLLMEIRKMKNGSSIISSYFSENDLTVMKHLFHNAEYSDTWSCLSHIIVTNRWINDEKLREFLRLPLLKICAHYLYKEKRRSNALNSVAHFHLRNGAVLWRLNWAADISPRGLDNSCGMMVNYRYYIDETETNSKKYMEEHYIKVSDNFTHLLTLTFNKSSL